MWDNSSSNFSTNSSSIQPPHQMCFTSVTSIAIFTSFFISYILLFVPLFISVLFVGFQRWRKRRSVATATMTSHSDIFTYNMVSLELISVFGSCFYCLGAYNNGPVLMKIGMDIFSMISPGQTLFHLLTCVERYLAVVHPVTYLGLRRAGGVRIRNTSIGCVWLLCLVSQGIVKLGVDANIVYSLVLLVFSSVVVSFCSVSTFSILIRPGPGEVGGQRGLVDQSKQRALLTIVAIMGALLMRFFSCMVSNVIYVTSVSDVCVVMWCVVWFSLPSSLVLPLLFLHRARKLPKKTASCTCS